MLLLAICKMPNQREDIRWRTNLQALWLDTPTSELNRGEYQGGFRFSDTFECRQVFGAKIQPSFVYDPD